MNFLLHRHLAERDLSSEKAGLGAMLPDLWRMADRRVRAVLLEPPVLLVEDDPASALMSGIGHHLFVDGWFHRASLFVDGERALGALLRADAYFAPRMGLLAHVAWELCLDGALVRARGVDATVAAVRASFASAAPETRARAVDAHHFDRVPRREDEKIAFASHMRLIEERLCDGRWVAAYGAPDGLSQLISGVRRRLGLGELGEADRTKLAHTFEAIGADADRALDEILGDSPLGSFSSSVGDFVR